jgi:tetratricopeptide (TPR) repeat protein
MTQMWTILGVAATAVVSLISLDLVAGQSVALAPFGWRHLIFVHVLATLPLSWALAAAISRVLPDVGRLAMTVAWCLVGGVMIGLTFGMGDFVGRALYSAQAGYVIRLMIRVGWCALLQTPWLAAVQVYLGSDSPSGSRRWVSAWSLALLAAFTVPTVYTAHCIEIEASATVEQISKRRFDAAERRLQPLLDLGSESPLIFVNRLGKQESVTPRQAMKDLSKKRQHAQSRVNTLQPIERNFSQQLELASHLAALDQPDEARKLLTPLADENIHAAMLLGRVDQETGRWPASRQRHTDALRMAQESGEANSPTGQHIQQQAYDALAYNAREMRRYAEAEQYYRDALKQLPDHEAHFHHQLARHFDQSGRVVKAREHAQRAHGMAPEVYPQPLAVWLWGSLMLLVVAYVVVQEFVLLRSE